MPQPNTYIYNIAQRDLDFTRRPTLSAVTDHVLAAAGDDADVRGFGLRTLMENNWSWVLSRFCIEFDRYPRQYETLHVHTWVSEVGRLMTVRNFVIETPEGERLGAAVSNWAMIDIASRKAVDLSANLDYSNAVVALPSPVASPVRLGAVKEGTTSNHQVVYSDLDFNRHTNTMRYIDMMMNMLSLKTLEDSTIHRLDLNFVAESRYADNLTIAMNPQQTGITDFEISNMGQTVCRARLEITDNQ